MIKDLVNLQGVLHGDFNWVRGAQRIELERLLDTFSLCNVNLC